MSEETNKPQEESYELTPLGWLAAKTAMFGAFIPIWDEFCVFVSDRAKHNGMEDGTPCVVLKDGGHCITVAQAIKNAEKDESA